MMIYINKTREEVLEFYDVYSSGRNPKLSKNLKGYDGVRGCKNKRLCEYEEN